MAGIQFRGVEQVMQAFENRDVDAWSMWQGKQFLFKGYGEADLRAILESIAVNSTNAIYTIRVYETINDVKNIKEKSECDGSFNFRLDDERQEITGAQYSRFTQNNSVFNRLAAIEEKLNNPPPADDDEEEETIGSVAIDIMKNPDKALKWAEVIRNIFSFNQPQQPPGSVRHLPISTTIQQQPASMGNVTQPAKELTEQELERLDKVTDLLFLKDPDFLVHLEKLAQIAENNPKKFKSLLTMLEIF